MENLNNFNQENMKGVIPEKKKRSVGRKIFCFVKWFLVVFIALFVVALILRSVQLSKIEKTNKQVEVIHSTKITMDDVMGTNLPPDPGEAGNRTVIGIDSNGNGIRDDVEVAIFREYPNSAKTRAALLQYARAHSMVHQQSFMNNELATEISREISRGSFCIGEVVPEGVDSFEQFLSLTNFMEVVLFNTEDRINSSNDFFEKVRSYSDLENNCDLDYSILPN